MWTTKTMEVLDIASRKNQDIGFPYRTWSYADANRRADLNLFCPLSQKTEGADKAKRVMEISEIRSKVSKFLNKYQEYKEHSFWFFQYKEGNEELIIKIKRIDTLPEVNKRLERIEEYLGIVD